MNDSNPYIFSATGLPSDVAMLDDAVRRVLGALAYRVDKLHGADNLDALCHGMRHLSMMCERHRETLRALGSLLKDSNGVPVTTSRKGELQ